MIKFNKGHAPHENMIYWFALPAGQTPVGRTEFVTVNADGTNVQWSNGAGAGANKPLPEMWPYGVNDSRSWDYKIRNRSGQVIYDWPTVHINSLKDLARASDYFSEAGATPATKAFGRQTFEYINGERPTESPGVPKVYTFIGKGDASYTISFKTQGPTIDKLYYAAGGRALEYNQLFMYSQLYVESTQDYQQRLNGLRQVVNRTYRIGTTKRVEVSQGNVQTKKVLESTNLNIDDFMDDPLSYVKTPSNKVLGFYPTSANTNAFRPGGVNPLNEYQLSQLFTDDKLQQAARTGSPIRLMIGFDYPDAFGNGETLVPVNLTVLPEIQHNIKFFKNDDGQNIADKPASKQAGHPVFYVYAGNQGNASVNLGGSVTSIQPLRINLTSNENFTDKDWQITGIPRTLHIENSTNRTNNARERNIELVGNLLPGDYFGTIRFGRKEQLFEIRVKPHTPRITTTAEELRGTALQKVPVTVTDIPLDPSALVYLVIPTSQTRDGGSEADQIPSGYTKIATGTPDGVHSTITIRPEDYVVFIPPVGNQIRALIFYNNVVASNMSNAVTILPDDIPPTINNPVGLNAKYYRGDEVSFTMGVSDRHSGLKSTTITTLPSGWTSNLTKSDKKNGSLAISGRVSMNQAYNSDITFKVSATDNVNNTTNDSQSKHVTVHVGKISDDAHPIVLGNSEKVVVVNPTALTGDEKQRITTAFMNKNQNIRGYLASSNPVTVDNHGNVTLQYRDGSSTTLDATNVMTYEPVVKPEYQTANAAKTATVTIAKGQSFNIGDIKQYFTLSNGQAIPSSSFTNITSDRTIPTAQEVSQMNAGTQLYHIVATNAYHKDTEDFYITLKIIDVKQPEGDQRVYRMSTYDITTDEISKVKQAFINANRDAISFAEGDISVTNTPNGSNVSTITVNINKGRLTKSFTSNLNNMNFLRWVNFPQDYTVTWTNAKIANRPTDGGLSWSDDHKSLIYRYDATLGTQITTNDILTLLKATTTVPGLRNNIAGNEKAQAEAGGRPNYKTTGYSQSNPTSDGQRQFTLNGQVIQIMDIINPSNGFGGQPVTNSNVRANHSNSTVVSVNESAANGAGAFTIDHVVKNNSTHNAADAVYKAQLYLSPYGPKQYVEHLNQNTDNTNEAINIYFVPSDLVNPTISVGNYTNHQVFSGETFTNTITANDNFGVQSVTVPTTSQLTGTVDNNHQHVSATAPNVTSTTNKTINLVATDTSGNTATTSFNVTIKPLRDKYRVGTSSTAANPVRIANISNNATVSQADQTAIINSLTFTSNAPNRNYATASANEITSKTVSNVSRTGNNAQVTVTVTYQDGTTSTVTVPVKHVIPEIVAHSHYTVQGQDFPTGNGASASDYFKLSNGSAIPDATITWVSGQAPNKNNTTIGQDINVTAHILIDGETTPITKTATYKVVRTVPKQVFETARGVLYPGVSDMYDAKQYVKPVNNSWSTNAQHMNFQFTNSYGPSKDVVGISTRDIRVTYDNHQTQIIKILSKVKPDPPRIDGNSVTYKAGLTNQQIKINNVLSSSSIKLFKADNTPLTITNTTYGSGNTAVVTVSDALPNGEIKARSSISMNNVTYTTQDEHGRAIDVTRNESVDSNDSASVHVTPQLQATTEGAVFIKGGDGFDFGHVERFIQNPPHGATVAWHDNPDTWKNTVGNTHKTAVVTLPNGQGTRNVEVPVKVYPVANAKAPSRDVKGQNLTNGTDAINYITFDPNTNTNGITAAWANRQQPNNQQAGVQHLNVDVTYPGISAAKRVPVTVNVYQFEFPQTSYTTTVGGTLASGTQASGYAHIQNATGLPTDGFTYKWNNAQNVQAVNDIKQTTQSLNTAMTGLKRGVANHNQVVQSDNYVNADTNKKNDYNNAYNHANDIINGNAQHPVITPSDVNNALSNVTSKEQALNGEAKLNAAKQEANTALGQLNNLNNAQRQNLQSQINGAHQIETVNTIKQNATNLNSAMGNLRQAVADKEQVKRTEDYADADTAKQNAYNSAVSSAETIINQTTNPTMSVNDVNSATSAVTTNKNALNGDEKLAQSKTDAASAIDALPHLNNAQKADVKSKINAASNIAGVNTVKQQGTDLNTAMGNLQGAINDEQTTLNSQNYQDATPSKKTAYTNAVQAAKDILNKSNGQNKTKDQVTEAMNQVNSAKNNLDGTRLLDQAKQTAKQQLNNMTHLTTAQKTHLTNQINSGTTVAGVHTAQSNANTLDQAMNTLRQSIANKDATKASEDYVDANNDKQTAYNNAVAAAETIINANSNPEMNPSTITQKAEQVNSSKTALNGDENLATAKLNAKTYLNTLTSITDAQKNNLISQISSATRVSSVDTVKQNAQHLDQAMASLQNGINNESQVKSSEKYRDADTNKQQEYDNAITAAKAILNKQHGPNTAQNAVEAALQRVKTAKNALNGDAKLIAAQNAAKQHLGTLTHITTAQRNDLTNQISQATNLAGVESVKQSANSLDGAMGNLQTAINDKSGTLASQNFLDADEQKRNAYNQAVSNAETILNKQTGPNTAKTAVEQALNNVNSAKHALNGTQNLNNAKQAAITAINGASDLNQHQKDALKAQANGAQRVSNAQDVQRNATELNTAMGQLQHAIADKTTTLVSSKFVNADSTKQNVYTTKVTNAEHIISGTPTVVTTPSEVTAAANQVNSAKQELNGDERLRVAKQNANTAIDALTQLNTPQKAKLKEQVGQANRLEDVQSVQTNGQSLNNAMKGLRDSIANETTVKASQNYTDASPNNQSTYNSAVSNAKGIINQTNNPTMDASAITQATTQVNNAKNGLNGAENLRNAQNTAKQNLNTLSHLTNNQKSAISSQIDRAGHVSEVTAAKNAATELNTQMGNLEQAIHDQNTVKQGVNFTDADKAKRDAYTNAVSRAETILNKTQGANTPKQDVEAAIQSVTSAKNALNGDQNVTNAKNAAKHALNNLTSINNAQKRDLTTKIDQATTVSGVEAVSNTGTQLNTAMANLQNGINDKTNTLASENYHDADSDKKTAYTQAVTNAENILNKNSGSNLDKAAVENALSQVTNAKGALNGNHNLEQAKSNANTTINGLQHLTTAQKDKLKQQVQQAQNVAGVDTVKSSANTLNGAMGTLRNSIQDNAATKNGQNYLDATESNKTNYNNAVDSANGVINATSNPNMDANAINQIATQVTSTKNALDGTHNLTQAKQTATNAIDGATNLNKAQKDALKAQVTSAQRVANVTSIQQTANELNTAMGQLQHGIDDENATKQTQKYRDAEQSKKTAYDQAVAAAKAILNKQTGSNSDKAAVDRALQQVTSTKDALNGDAKLAEAKAAAKQNLGTLNHITNAQRTDLEGQINQATTVDGVNTVKTNANTLDGAMNSLQGSINDKDATLRNQNYLDADESKRNAYTQAVTAAEGILNKQTGGNTSKADVDNALNAVTRAKAALNGADNLRNAKTSATNTINGLPHLTQLQKDNLKHQVEQAQNVAGVNGVKDKGNTLNTAMGALRTSIQNDNTTKTSQNYLDASDINKNNYNTAVNNANGVINATNNPNMDANAINGMANQVNTTKAALNGVQNLAQAKTNAMNTINNAHDLNQKQKDALKTQVNNAQRVSDANNVQHTATELNGAMTVLKAAIADKERTKASGNYVNADQEKRQAYDSKVTNAENIINGTPNATLTVNDVNSATSQVNAAKTALNGDNNLRVAKEHANNTIDGLAQLNNAQKAKLKEQVQSATTLDGVQTVKNSSQTLNTAMKGLRDSIANEATIKAGQNYTDASPNNRNEYDSAVTAAKAIINQTSNPTMEPNTITQATSQVTTKEQALNGAQNLAQAKTTAKNNLNNLTSINNAQKDALTRSIDGATTVAGVNQETVKATELNNAMHSLQNGINDETQTKQTQKYLDAEPSKKSAYDQAVNAAKAILTKASGQNVDKAAVEQALQNVNSTKTALNGDAKLNEAKAAAKQTLGTLTHINNAQRTALDNEITQATNVEGVNTVKAKAQQLDGAMGQLETSIRDKDTTLQSQNYQDADDAKRTAYSQAVNAAATILNKTSGGNTPKADVERAMQAVTQANTALNGIQNLERAKQAANTAITNASDLNTKQKEALKAQVTSAGRVSVANGVEHTATELNTAMTALKRAIADKADTKASGNYVNADANKRQAYDEKVTAAENIVSGTPTPTLTPSDVTNAATQVTNAKTQLNGNHNLEVAKQNANTAIDGLTSLNGPQKAKLKEQVGQATTLPNVQTVRDNAQILNTAMKGLRDSIANEATIKAEQNYTDASPNNRSEYDSAVTAAKAIIGQTSSPTMNAQEINQAKDQVTAKQQALNGQENLTNAQTNAKQHLNGLSDLTNAQKDAAKRQIEGATHVSEVTQAQNNADALNTAMTNLKNGIQDQNTIKQGVNFTDADEAKRNAYTNAVTQAEQILNKVQGPNTAKDNVESALQNVQRAKNDLNGNQNVANAKTTAKNALNNLTSINNAQKEALKSQIDSATTVAGVNQVSATASELNTAMSNLQNGINDEAATKAAQKYTDADSDKQTAYNDAVTAAKTLLDKTAGTNDNKAAVEQALQRVNTAKTALNGDARLNQAKNTAKQQLATMSHLTDAQKANLTSQIERGTTVAGVQGIQANAGTLNEAMNQLRQSIASKDATKASEDYHDANTDLQNAYNDAVTNAEGIISATNNPEMNPDTINQKASQVNSAKSALNGDEKLAAAKQTAKSDIGRLTDLNNAQRTAANAEVDQAPNLAAVTAAKNKATSLNTAMGNLKHALAEKDNTKRSVNYTDADQPKQQAYDTAVTQAEAITNANGSNANETQVQAALNQLNQAKNDLNGDNKVAQAKETAKRALASYSNLNNAQSTAATSQIDNATTVAGVTAAQNTANELNTAMGQLQNGINDQNTVKQQVNFTDADQGKKDAYTNAVTNAQGILDKVHGQNQMRKQT